MRLHCGILVVIVIAGQPAAAAEPADPPAFKHARVTDAKEAYRGADGNVHPEVVRWRLPVARSTELHGTGGTGRDPFRLVFEAEWNDIPCTDYPLTPEQWAAECIAPLVNTQVDCLLYNLCSSDGYCCQLNNGELLMDTFDKLPDAWVWRYRENTKRLVAADANPPKLACEYGHRLGMAVIPIVRMNDMHDMFYRFEVSRFKLGNPRLLLGNTGADWKPDWSKGYSGLANKQGIDAFTWGMFDYAHPEVRDHKLAIIEEFITRWDNDGVCLDFDRDPRLFKEERKPENAALLTGMIRRIRATLDRVAKERGRPQYLYVRVIPRIDVCYARGMDVRTWVQEGLVDVIAPGCGYLTFSLKLAEWLDLVRGRSCCIVPSINHWKPTEQTRAWAKLMRQRGAHGVQLFNYGHLLYGHGPDTDPEENRLGSVWFHELHPDYYKVLHELGDLNTFSFQNCRYVWESVPHDLADGEAGLSHRRFRAIDDIVLPVELTQGQHTIPFGFADDLSAARQLGLSPRVTLRLMISNSRSLGEYELLINGQVLTRDGQPLTDGHWASINVPHDCLKLGENEFSVSVKIPAAGPVPRLEKVVIDVRYVETPPTKTVVQGIEPVPLYDVKVPVPLNVGKHATSFQVRKKVRDLLASSPDRQLILRMKVGNYTYYDELEIRLNGDLLPTESRRTRAVFIMRNDSWLEYPVKQQQLRQGANEIQVDVRAINPQISSIPVLESIELAQ